MSSYKAIQGYAFIIYPESCPLSNITEHLLDKFPLAISPLHDRDITKDGKLKKAHYHVLLSGRLDQKGKRFIEKITGINWFEPIYSINDYYDYLYHWKDEWFIPNKAQYWKSDIIESETFELKEKNNNVTDNDLVKRAFAIISCYDEFSELIDDLLQDDCNADILDYCIHNYNLVNTYIRSSRNRITNYRMEKRSCLASKREDENFLDNTYVHDKRGDEISDLHSWRIAHNIDMDIIYDDIGLPIPQ